MTDLSPDLAAATFAKTAAGIQEIQNRALGLPPMTRRLLVLVDGKRSGKELAAFASGHDAVDILGQLLAQGCIEALAVAEAAPVAAPAPAGAAELSGLPQASARSAKDIEMARNFMTNTINTMFGQNMRLTLIEAIFSARTADDLRQVYPVWAETMASLGVGAKRLPELRQKLFQVL
ncbi:hypothetical protein [Polaromonas sp.]|jgi:hypothetical protein|uniref:hypothetical protein n=1 Tax=Polaromonas sp. TaxID=1869339 RepID=UPI001D51B8CD|nr:hypothetical protein [Polaromonas sp.]MBT9476116.1 hypothetical protein [Polaromonas sp.]